MDASKGKHYCRIPERLMVSSKVHKSTGFYWKAIWRIKKPSEPSNPPTLHENEFLTWNLGHNFKLQQNYMFGELLEVLSDFITSWK